MPLASGNSRSVVSSNIREMVASGRPQRIAVAAALSNARRHPRRASGGIVGYPTGGAVTDYGTGYSPDFAKLLASTFGAPGASPLNNNSGVVPITGPNPQPSIPSFAPIGGGGFAPINVSGFSNPFGAASGTFNPTGYAANDPRLAITPQVAAAPASAPSAAPTQAPLAPPDAVPPQAWVDDGGGGYRGGSVAAIHRASGGYAPTSVVSSAADNSPVAQSQMSRYQAMSPQQLQQLSIILGSSPQGQMASQVLHQKRLMPNAQPAMPNTSMERGGSVDEPGAYEEGGAVGYLHGATPGRTDVLHIQPPGGSYVIPADVVSGLGDGNSIAGAAILNKAFRVGPWGTTAGSPHGGSGVGIPHPPPAYNELISRMQGPAAARGGKAKSNAGVGVPTPIIAASGEFIVDPGTVAKIGGGDMKRGHDALDAWTLQKRRETIDKMKSLKPPKKR